MDCVFRHAVGLCRRSQMQREKPEGSRRFSQFLDSRKGGPVSKGGVGERPGDLRQTESTARAVATRQKNTPGQLFTPVLRSPDRVFRLLKPEIPMSAAWRGADYHFATR